jgi:hypothetical protein
VVGLAGAGKSNLLGFFCHRPDVLRRYLSKDAPSVIAIPVDLNNLPANNLATLYRIILRSFYEVRAQFDSPLQQTVVDLYLENRATDDPFLSQSALRELLFFCQSQQTRVVLVLDRFDKFCHSATPEVVDTLRGLRDSFKETLCYIVGMRQEIVYLSDTGVLGELYEILDTHLCWVGPLNQSDARRLIEEETYLSPRPLQEKEITYFLALTGGHPSLLKAAYHWWQAMPDKPVTNWLEYLMRESTIQHRLSELWRGLSQEEQRVLVEIQGLQQETTNSDSRKKTNLIKAWQALEERYQKVLSRLASKGMAQKSEPGWQIFSELLSTHVATVKEDVRGRIWFDAKTNALYQGPTALRNLAPLEDAVLRFLVSNPRVRCTKTEIISHAWPPGTVLEGVTDEALFQVIRGIRTKIEPAPSNPRYIVTWLGKPEGGYQCFPEGRPG